MESWKRKLRMGMVGGGQGAFIGGVHRIAATLDQQVELVAGCFSQSYENTKVTGAQLYLDPARCYRTYEAMAAVSASVLNLLDLDGIVLGGGLGTRFGEDAAQRLRAEMQQHLFHTGRDPQVLTAVLGDDGGAIGASLLVRE